MGRARERNRTRRQEREGRGRGGGVGTHFKYQYTISDNFTTAIDATIISLALVIHNFRV